MVKDFFTFFFVTHFPLLCISIGMIFVVIYGINSKKRLSRYIISIIVSALILAVLLSIEKTTYDPIVATICAFLGYSFRPVVLYMFLRLACGEERTKLDIVAIVLLVINTLVHSLSLFMNTEVGKAVFYYTVVGEGVKPLFNRGTLGLNFTSHFISLYFLIVFIYTSCKKIRLKQSTDALALFSCSLFVVVAVIIESSTQQTGLLNNAIGVSIVFCYLFMHNQINRKDELTDLFDRKTFFIDEKRFAKSISAIIQLDMNGLKKINDNEGHTEGDLAISTIGHLIINKASSKMIGYRLGGDEFIVLALNCPESEVKQFIEDFKEGLKLTRYSCSCGYCYRENGESFKEMMKSSEEAMYQDKSKYYIDNHIDRRRR